MLLINVDGRRSVMELQETAWALRLGSQALQLQELQRGGWITGLPQLPPTPASAAAQPAEAARAAPVAADYDLRRLMRAKMFAFDLACRMLAGRDAELHASAREVDSESRFLEWLAEASACIEAASDGERPSCSANGWPRRRCEPACGPGGLAQRLPG